MLNERIDNYRITWTQHPEVKPRNHEASTSIEASSIVGTILMNGGTDIEVTRSGENLTHLFVNPTWTKSYTNITGYDPGFDATASMKPIRYEDLIDQLQPQKVNMKSLSDELLLSMYVSHMRMFNSDPVEGANIEKEILSRMRGDN